MNATVERLDKNGRTRQTKCYPVNFRFPVEQITETQVRVCVDMIEGAPELVSINPLAVKAWNLSDAETEAAYAAAMDAIIKSVMIIK